MQKVEALLSCCVGLHVMRLMECLCGSRSMLAAAGTVSAILSEVNAWNLCRNLRPVN